MPTSQLQMLGFQAESEHIIVRRVSRRVGHYIDDLLARPDLSHDQRAPLSFVSEFADESPTQVLMTRKDDSPDVTAPVTQPVIPTEVSPVIPTEVSPVIPTEVSPVVSIQTDVGLADTVTSMTPLMQSPPEVTLTAQPLGRLATPAVSAAPERKSSSPLRSVLKPQKIRNEADKIGALTASGVRVGGVRKELPSKQSESVNLDPAPVPDFPRLPDMTEFRGEFTKSDNEDSETRKSFVFPETASNHDEAIFSDVRSTVSNESFQSPDSSRSPTSEMPRSEERPGLSRGGLIVGFVIVVVLAAVYYFLSFEKFIY